MGNKKVTLTFKVYVHSELAQVSITTIYWSKGLRYYPCNQPWEQNMIITLEVNGQCQLGMQYLICFKFNQHLTICWLLEIDLNKYAYPYIQAGE